MASLYTWLCLLITFEFTGTTWFALRPLSGAIDELASWRGWRRLYTLGESNLDVWVLSLLSNVLLVGMIAATTSAQRPAIGAPVQSNKTLIIRAANPLINLTQLLLLSKAVAVAVLSPPYLWPPPHRNTGSVGLIYMYSSICWLLAASTIQHWLIPAAIKLRAKHHRRVVGAAEQEPLLPTTTTTTTTSTGTEAEGKKGSAGAASSKDEDEDEAQQRLDTRTVMDLVRLATPDFPLLMVAFMAGGVAALGQALIPFYTGLIIDYASVEHDRRHFLTTIGKLVAVSFACAIFTGARGGLFIMTMAKLNVRLRTRLFQSLLRQDVAFYDKNRTGEITSRLSADTSKVADSVGLNLNVMLRSITQAMMVLGFMFAASWRLTIVTFILVPVTLFICKVYGLYWRELTQKVQSELAGANTVAEEALSSITTVKAHAAQDSTEAAYADKLSGFYTVQLKSAAAYTLWAMANTFLPNCVAAVVLFYGGTLVFQGEMTRGALISFILYQQSLSGAFQMIGDVFSALMGALGAADKVVQLLRREPEIKEEGALIPATFEGRIQLEGVHFCYPSRPESLVLRGLSLSVQPGEVVALVGPSGGGKSSIMKLVERFYAPQRGAVLVDGRDIGAYHPKWLRRQVALVAQEPVLYARSIRRNIAYGLEEQDGCTPPSQEEVEEAARQANAADFIAGFPEGYETDCGEKGVALSGGQKQRIAIARALVRRPRVLLLDEATSALDAESEAVVQEALDRVMQGRTVLVIAHRLSTVQDADRIIVVAHGVVQETGTHEELLEAGGMYSSLVRRQLSKAVSSTSLARGLPSSSSMGALSEG